MTERFNLHPCPFCGGKATPVFRSGVTGRVCRSKWFRGFIKCTSCEATGPVRKNPLAAVISWNQRTTEPAQLVAAE